MTTTAPDTAPQDGPQSPAPGEAITARGGTYYRVTRYIFSAVLQIGRAHV